MSECANAGDFQRAHRKWVEQGLENGFTIRDERWSESIAVGSLEFVANVKNQLGVKAAHRDVIETDGSYALREPVGAYGRKLGAENEDLSSQNTFFWDENIDDART